MQQLLQGHLLVRDAIPNAAKYSFRHICVFLPFRSEGLLVKTRFLWQGRHLPWARLISKWPGCSHCPGLGEHFIPVWPILVSYQPWPSAGWLSYLGRGLFQSRFKDHPCPLGLPPASHATLKLCPAAFGSGPFPWSSGWPFGLMKNQNLSAADAQVWSRAGPLRKVRWEYFGQHRATQSCARRRISPIQLKLLIEPLGEILDPTNSGQV